MTRDELLAEVEKRLRAAITYDSSGAPTERYGTVENVLLLFDRWHLFDSKREAHGKAMDET